MYMLSGVSWHFVLIFGAIGGAVLAIVDRFRKRSEMQWLDVALNGMLFSAVFVFPWFGDYKNVLLALSLGWLIQAVVGLLWSRLAKRLGRGTEAEARG